MDEFFQSQPDDAARARAIDFEQKIQEQEAVYMDLSDVEAIFQYYAELDDLGKAQTLVSNAFVHHPYSADLFYKQSGIDFELSKFDDALHNIEQACDLDPQEGIYYAFKAEIYAQLGQYKPAIETLLESLNDNRLEAFRVYMQMGHISQIFGFKDDALRYLKTAIDMQPDSEDAHFELAFLYESENELETCVKIYHDFLEQDPFSANGWYNLATVQFRQGLLDEALESFDFALAIQDDFSSAYFNKGRTLLALERYTEALQCFMEVQTLDANDKHTLYHIAECYESLEHWKLGLRYYLKVIDQDQSFIDAWLGIAYCLEELERFAEAIHHYRKAQVLDDEGNIDIQLSIAMCEYKLGNLELSYRELQKAIDVNPNELQIWEEWAELLANNENPSGAITFLEEGIKHNPHAASLYFRSVGYLMRINKKAKALLMLENALLLGLDSLHLLHDLFPEYDTDEQVKQVIRQYKKD